MGNLESHDGVSDGVDLSSLLIDQAYVHYKNNNTHNEAWFYSLTPECDQCDPELEVARPLSAGQQVGQPLSIKFGTELYAANNSQGHALSPPCVQDAPFSEFGIYSCEVRESDVTGGGMTCACAEVAEGYNIYWPLLCMFGYFFGLAALWLLSLYIYGKSRSAVTRWRQQRNSLKFPSDDVSEIKMTSLGPIESTEQLRDKSKSKQRIKAIDTLRGVSICIMIFVNYGGGGYWFFNHAPWNGITVADLVFPWFMWIMGVCIPMSTRSMLKRKGGRKRRVFLKICRRCAWLFLLGLAVSNIDNINIRVLRVFGVLQRFSLTYLVVASLHLLFLKTGSATPKEPGLFSDVVGVAREWACQGLIVTLHLLLTFLLPVPGCPTGYLGPGGRHEGGRHFNCTGGAAGYIDRQVLGDAHTYQHPTSDEVYGGVVPFDPEGILGTLQACFTVFLGVQAGMVLITHAQWKGRVVRWLSWSLITGAVAAILCRVSANDGWIPINKNLWSLSFVLVTACFAYFLLSAFYFLLDVMRWWNGAPFFYPGMNSILLYVGHELTTTVFPFQWSDSEHSADLQTHGYQVILDVWVVSVWILVSAWLYRIKFFVAL